ncbi:MAG: (2Fe-2S)-binding protein [bacterium]|nr:(2Fe-2S)-binding protein [bacterium]
MSQDSKPKQISRRKFIQGVGTGVIGGAVLPNALSAKQKKTQPQKPHPGKELLVLKVNGKPVRAMIEPQTTLAEFLRNDLKLTGTKVVCNQGECGACTVLMDGKAIYSCHILALDAAGKDVLTIEGLLSGEKLHPIQEAFVQHDGLQCGFCTPGQILAAQALLLKHPKPTGEQVKEGMAGNLCRCAAYPNIFKSVMAAAEAAAGNV